MKEPEEHPPPTPNCRCVLLFVVHENWLEDLEETMDEHIGDTMPLIDVFIEPGIILQYL